MTAEEIIIEILKLLGGALLILVALMGYEIFLIYKQKKDRDGL
jgi:hypothetical protein